MRAYYIPKTGFCVTMAYVPMTGNKQTGKSFGKGVLGNITYWFYTVAIIAKQTDVSGKTCGKFFGICRAGMP